MCSTVQATRTHTHTLTHAHTHTHTHTHIHPHPAAGQGGARTECFQQQQQQGVVAAGPAMDGYSHATATTLHHPAWQLQPRYRHAMARASPQ